MIRYIASRVITSRNYPTFWKRAETGLLSPTPINQVMSEPGVQFAKGHYRDGVANCCVSVERLFSTTRLRSKTITNGQRMKLFD